jgi:hypothetical protein
MAQAPGHVAAFVEGVKVIAASNVDVVLGAADGADVAVTVRTLVDLGNERAGYSGYLAHTIAAAPPWDAAAPFVRTGAPIVALDLRALTGKPAAWFTTPHPTRELGWLFYSERMLSRMGVLTERFDAALYVARSSSARMLQK